MQEGLLREIATTQPWQTESIRLTAFPSPSVNLENADWWRTVTGQQSETVSRPRTGGYQEAGAFQGGRLILNMQPTRIDWKFTPIGQRLAPDPNPNPSLPTIGPLSAVLPSFVEVMTRWLAAAPAIQRIALGPVFFLPVVDLQEGYRRLVPLLDTVRIDPDGSADLFYQINRPRVSRLGIPTLRMNRLSKWSVVVTQQVLVRVSPGAPQLVETQPVVASRVELDVNTAPSFEGDLPRDRLADILDEMADLSLELALRGDIP